MSFATMQVLESVCARVQECAIQCCWRLVLCLCEQLKSLEAMVEQVKVEDRRASLGFPVTPKAGDKRSKSPFKGGGSPFKGPGSPFKCMGKGLSQQMNSELDAELSANQRRIEELDALATSRQKEVGFSSFFVAAT